MVRFALVGAVLLAAISPVIAAGTVTDQWASLCDDEKCSKNCGQWVSLANPGCLNGGSRKSFKVKEGAFYGKTSLVVSPKSGCNCQKECKSSGPDGWSDGCHKLPKGESFRFIGGGCDKDNC